jgi:hypothetical protein
MNLRGFQGGRGFKAHGEEVDALEPLPWDDCDELHLAKESYLRRHEAWWEGESHVL